MIGPGLTTYTYTDTYMYTYIPICVHIYICTHRQTTCTYKTEIKIQSKFAPNLASQNRDLNLKTNEPAYVQECRIQEICKIFHISLQNGFLKNSNRRGPGPGPGPCAHHNHCLHVRQKPARLLKRVTLFTSMATVKKFHLKDAMVCHIDDMYMSMSSTVPEGDQCAF